MMTRRPTSTILRGVIGFVAGAGLILVAQAAKAQSADSEETRLGARDAEPAPLIRGRYTNLLTSAVP
jgi:hypothetical protein